MDSKEYVKKKEFELKHIVTEKNVKNFRITQVKLYKDGIVCREKSNAIEID